MTQETPVTTLAFLRTDAGSWAELPAELGIPTLTSRHGSSTPVWEMVLDLGPLVQHLGKCLPVVSMSWSGARLGCLLCHLSMQIFQPPMPGQKVSSS